MEMQFVSIEVFSKSKTGKSSQKDKTNELNFAHLLISKFANRKDGAD